MDYPTVMFYEQLLLKYPNSKIVLTERDFDAWYDSTMETIYGHGGGASWAIRVFMSATPFFSRWYRLMMFCIWGYPGTSTGIFHGKFEDRKYVHEIYKKWGRDIRQNVPACQLLVWDVGQGWEPLCKFLNKEVPLEPFPHSALTERTNMLKMNTAFHRAGLALILLAPISVPVLLALWLGDTLRRAMYGYNVCHDGMKTKKKL